MNNFTKDELEEVYLALQGYDFDNIDIIMKLQSMIDNYCEHDKRIASHDECGQLVVQCGQCDLVLWHEVD